LNFTRNIWEKVETKGLGDFRGMNRGLYGETRLTINGSMDIFHWIFENILPIGMQASNMKEGIVVLQYGDLHGTSMF
jgi:hypothetical protein